MRRAATWTRLAALMGGLALACWIRTGTALGAETPGQVTSKPVLANQLQQRLANQPPSMLVIVADDLGYGDLGSYGQAHVQTPNLDRLAQEGMRFTQAYAGSPLGAASRAALLTGRHAGHGRIRGEEEVPLTEADVTLARILKSAGYTTGAIGQWGLGKENTTGTPHLQGFEEWLGFLSLAQGRNYYPPFVWRSSPRSEVYDTALVLDANMDGQQGIYIPDYFTMAATNFVRISRYQPFFLYLAYNLIRADPVAEAKTGHGMVVPSDAPYSREDWPLAEKFKAAMITRLDRYVGTLLQQLERQGLATNTIVVFTSDNGPHREGGVDPAYFKSAGPYRGGKGELTEGGLRVPFLVRWPGRVPAGVVVDQPLAFWDVLPTLAEAARLTPPEGLDGISLLPTLLGRKQTNQHEYLYWELPGDPPHQAVRFQNWKGWRSGPEQPVQLYNLTEDPQERKDLAGAHPEIVEKLQTILKSARTAP